MNTRIVFATAAGLSLLSSIVAGVVLVLPWAQTQSLSVALLFAWWRRICFCDSSVSVRC